MRLSVFISVWLAGSAAALCDRMAVLDARYARRQRQSEPRRAALNLAMVLQMARETVAMDPAYAPAHYFHAKVPCGARCVFFSLF